MLDHMEECGDKSIVSWQPHGRAFTVHKSKEFVTLIMPQFFNQTKYASFQRQLNLYGFSRLTHGPDKGAYYHSCFIRGERNLCRRMNRQKIKGTKVRKTLAPEEEPNFYKMTGKLPTIPSQDSMAVSSTAGQLFPIESPPVAVTPIVTKPIMNTKRQTMADAASSSTSSMQPSMISPRETMMMPTVSNMMRTVSPHVSSSTLYDPKYASASQQDAKGGDLLFFEGRPFRYLEHIEVLPPLPQSMSSTSSRPRHMMINTQHPNPRTTSLHDMITAIVDLEPPQKTTDYQSSQRIASV
jgi:hypothetical protein